MSPLTLIPLIANVTPYIDTLMLIPACSGYFCIFCSFALMTINLDTPHPISHLKVLIMAPSKDQTLQPLPIEKEVQQLTGEGRFLLRPYFLFLWKWNLLASNQHARKSLSLTLSPKRSCKKRTSNLRWSCKKSRHSLHSLQFFTAWGWAHPVQSSLFSSLPARSWPRL